MSTAASVRDLLEAYIAAKMMKEGLDKANLVADLLDRAGRSLLEAVKAGEIDECSELLAIEGVDIHIKESPLTPNYGMTPVMLACKYGHLDILEYLVSEGSNIHDENIYSMTPVMLACAYGHLDIMEYLVSRGANINDKSNGGNSCLMDACFEGHLNIAEYLMSKGAKIHEMDNQGNTCFSYACNYNHINVLYRLRKWPTTMAILVLQELALIYIIDSESVIDLHQYLGRPEDLKTDDEGDYRKDDEGNVVGLVAEDNYDHDYEEEDDEEEDDEEDDEEEDDEEDDEDEEDDGDDEEEE